MGLLDSINQSIPNIGGILGMALLNKIGGNNSGIGKAIAMGMLSGDNSFSGLLGTAPQQNNVAQGSSPTLQNISNYNLSTPVSLPTDKQALLSQLKQEAAGAYPNNPTMQQVAITQAIQESNLMGKPSQLAAKYNNFFGIKAPGTAGTVNMRTGEFLNGANTTVNAGFGRNSTIGDSFMQHANLMQNKRYAGVVGAQSPYDAFGALQRAGYATDPNYAKELGRVYQSYVAPLY